MHTFNSSRRNASRSPQTHTTSDAASSVSQQQESSNETPYPSLSAAPAGSIQAKSGGPSVDGVIQRKPKFGGGISRDMGEIMDMTQDIPEIKEFLWDRESNVDVRYNTAQEFDPDLTDEF
ncbi:MAG: hypothetical protein AAF570_18900, partial [Bacteroidota bacterium]